MIDKTHMLNSFLLSVYLDNLKRSPTRNRQYHSFSVFSWNSRRCISCTSVSFYNKKVLPPVLVVNIFNTKSNLQSIIFSSVAVSY